MSNESTKIDTLPKRAGAIAAIVAFLLGLSFMMPTAAAYADAQSPWEPRQCPDFFTNIEALSTTEPRAGQ